MSRRIAVFTALAAAVVLFVSVNVIADRTLRGTRVDLTQEHLYTLSPGSLATLSKIDEPITLRFYYSPRLGDEVPAYGVYAQRVREMLEQYAALANGKIKLEILDPQPFSPTEDRAVAFGLQGVPIEQGGDQVYFGLAATNSTDDQQVIPFFQPERERFLEYDLTKLVHSLAFPKKTVVGLVTDLPLEGDMMAAMQGRPMQPYAVIDQLRQLDEVRDLTTSFDKVPDDVDVLMVVHPQHLTDKVLYAIDQYVLKGGRALVFVDPDSETQQMHASRMNPPSAPHGSSFAKLFAAWGIAMDENMVAADRLLARKVNAGTAARIQPMDYVGWLSLKPANMNRDDIITADLSNINLATPGVLKPKDGAKTTFTPLLSTSPESMEIPAQKFEGMVPDIAGLLRDFKPGGQPLVIAAHVSGPAETAFPDGPPKDPPGAAKDDDKKDEAKPAEPAPQLKTSAQPINVVAVADTDILEDRFWVQTQDFFGQRVALPTANNADFVANAIEVLAGGNDLISLRSRGTSARPFELVNDLQRSADERYQATAKQLEDKLKDTEAKIKELRGGEGQGRQGVALAAEQTQAIDNFRAEMIQTRQQLRQVQLALREDINRLKALLEFFDIAFIPVLVALAALVLGILRLRRRKRRVRYA
jgi:ABC-type uncharacterized transport system involved in gliding motility auxiliary subunit